MRIAMNRPVPYEWKRLLPAATLLVIGTLIPPGAVHGQTVRDSAGIRIIENRGPLWTASNAWRFSPTPLVQIGAVEGDSTLLLNQTRNATRLSDGRIVVAQTSELRIFSPSGRYLQTIGRRGQGPGEFQFGISGVVALAGDSIAVGQARAIPIFDPRGTYARAFPLVPPGLLRDHRTEGGRILPDGDRKSVG